MPDVIYKYDLSISSSQYAMMPKASKILKVAFQDNQLRVWAMVDKAQPDVERYFSVIGTGELSFIRKYEFIDTVFQSNGLVWHVFDMGEG